MLYIVLKLKSTEDILQGISTLDYLFKISIFQKYRNPFRAETGEVTIGTT